MQLNDLFKQTVSRLEPDLGDYAVHCAERLLRSVLCCSREHLYLQRELEPDAVTIAHIESMVQRCKNHEPVDYVLGTSYFYDREFIVSPAVLIPRPDTEVLVETILGSEGELPLLVVDVGTGSGCIAAILAEKRPLWQVVGIEVSAAAAVVAQCNRQACNSSFVAADLFTSCKSTVRFDIIVSNPPYIATSAVSALDRSVKDFEPYGALDGGADGLRFYRYLAEYGAVHSAPDGRIYCEIGYDQELAIRAIFTNAGWYGVHCICDLAGHPRVIVARKSETPHE